MTACPLCTPAARARRARGGVLVVTVAADWQTITTGHWCGSCALPSAVQVTLVSRCPSHGWPESQLGRVAACQECGRQLPVD